jgi:DNA-binding beta-propeller fold protein YncE
MWTSLLAVAALGLALLPPISFPGGEKGIGFDDLRFAPAIHEVLIPGGRTGLLMLIDPATLKTETIAGFSERGAYRGGHGEGITSADEGRGYLFVTDRSSRQLDVIDPKIGRIATAVPLKAGPDYVRYVASTNEVWVTEPRAEQIEIFALGTTTPPRPESVGTIPVAGGPESLVIDPMRGRAYTNLWKDRSIAIDVKRREVIARWPNGCQGSRGIALDEERGFVLVGCEEGKLSVLDARDGKRAGEASAGAGVDIIAYDAKLKRAYLPGADSATMAAISISDSGEASVLATVRTAQDAHCVTADDDGHVYVCDPRRGRILVFDAGAAPSK